MKANGWIAYTGPSLLDGKPIVVVVTGFARRSKNPKTGNALQAYILRKNVSPVSACKSRGDRSVCGDCPLRSRGCYVRVYQAPQQVYNAYRRGSHTRTIPARERWATRTIRLGAYGDPSAVPTSVWRRMTALADGWTGYTHTPRRGITDLCMVSVESLQAKAKAKARGQRTFRIIRSADQLQRDEILCPASVEAGQLTTCERCRLCDGANARKSIAIVAHGRSRKQVQIGV